MENNYVNLYHLITNNIKKSPEYSSRTLPNHTIKNISAALNGSLFSCLARYQAVLLVRWLRWTTMTTPFRKATRGARLSSPDEDC